MAEILHVSMVYNERQNLSKHSEQPADFKIRTAGSYLVVIRE
jgi:hypothetical protein